MLLRCVTAAYLAYLMVPIALLVVGSLGQLWLNTLLPTGFTTQWYRDVTHDPSFRRAFTSSLAVASITCVACATIGLAAAYAVFRAESARVRAIARVLYLLPIALPPLVLAFGFVLVFSSDTLPWLPALRHSILAGLIIVAALSIGEFQFSNLVAGFLNRTYPIVLLQAFYGATGFACAATVILLLLALLASIGGAIAAGSATRLKVAAA